MAGDGRTAGQEVRRGHEGGIPQRRITQLQSEAGTHANAPNPFYVLFHLQVSAIDVRIGQKSAIFYEFLGRFAGDFTYGRILL